MLDRVASTYITDLDFGLLLTTVKSGPCPLFATVSGAHLYGFPSPDSDVDLRGAFVLPVPALLRLGEPQETINHHPDAATAWKWIGWPMTCASSLG